MAKQPSIKRPNVQKSNECVDGHVSLLPRSALLNGKDTQSPWTYCHQIDFMFSMNEEMEKNLKRDFGEKVKHFRKAKGLSQETLALMCELDRTYIGGVERGERNISLLNICKIANALGVSAREFFDA